jgi:hypothetical protein
MILIIQMAWSLTVNNEMERTKMKWSLLTGIIFQRFHRETGENYEIKVKVNVTP